MTTDEENAIEGAGFGEAASTHVVTQPLMSTITATAILSVNYISLPRLGAKRGLGATRHADHRAGRWHCGEGDIKERSPMSGARVPARFLSHRARNKEVLSLLIG